MAQITFDTDDNKSVLLAIGVMINELTGTEAPKVVKPAAEAPEPDASSEQASEASPSNSAVEGEAGNDESAQTATPGAGAANDAQVDHNGVPFDENFCAKAQKPFYASGKREGQWKRRGGVDESEYDEWYAGELEAVNADGGAADDDDGTVNTASAFGITEEPAQTDADMPKDAGVFMGWVAEKQAADLFTADQVGQAYVSAGVQVTDLFAPNTPADVEAAIAKVYPILKALL